MSFYQKHVFVCNNQKMPGKKCCAASGGEDAFAYVKEKLLDVQMHGPDKVRVSKSGCLGRCSKGPCMVVYPEGTWYTFSSQSELDKIVDNHLIAGQPVPELCIED